MGSTERSVQRATGVAITGVLMVAGAIIADRYHKDSGDVSTTDFDDSITCVRVEVTDTSINSFTRLSRDEVDKLPSPYPPDILCVKIKGTGYIKPK